MAQGEEVPIEEACAMTTRVSPSFIRIGHFDLFGLRQVFCRFGFKVFEARK